MAADLHDLTLYNDVAKLKSEVSSLQKGGGGGTSGGMEARLASLEANYGHLRDDVAEMKKDIRDLRNDARTDFRLLFGALIAVALGLAGLMAKGFHWF